MTDLSCIYCVGDQDEAQRCFDQLPKELVTHIWAAFWRKKQVSVRILAFMLGQCLRITIRKTQSP